MRIAHDIADLDLIAGSSVANVGVDRERTSGVAEDVIRELCERRGHVAWQWRELQ